MPYVQKRGRRWSGVYWALDGYEYRASAPSTNERRPFIEEAEKAAEFAEASRE